MTPKLAPEAIQERKAQILQAALACFARKGYHQTTMDDIVKESGLSKGGIYWHFDSKRDLLMSLFTELVGDPEEIFASFSKASTGARQKLEAVAKHFESFTEDSSFSQWMPLLMEIWVQEERNLEVQEIAVQIWSQYREPLAQIIRDGMASGEFRPVDADVLANILIGVYDGLMLQWMIDPDQVDWKAIRETLMETLVAGLCNHEPASQTSPLAKEPFR